MKHVVAKNKITGQYWAGKAFNAPREQTAKMTLQQAAILNMAWMNVIFEEV